MIHLVSVISLLSFESIAASNIEGPASYIFDVNVSSKHENSCEKFLDVVWNRGELIELISKSASLYKVSTDTEMVDAYVDIDWLKHPISDDTAQGRLAKELEFRGSDMNFSICEVNIASSPDSCLVGVVSEEELIFLSEEDALVVVEIFNNGSC